MLNLHITSSFNQQCWDIKPAEGGVIRNFLWKLGMPMAMFHEDNLMRQHPQCLGRGTLRLIDIEYGDVCNNKL
jgi:hypothetical protein